MNSISVGLFVVVMVSAFQAGTAINCFVCNSGNENEGSCADPFVPSDGFIKNCSNLPEDVNSGRNVSAYKYCRKFYQDVEGEIRIVRTCATEGRLERCIDRTGTAKIKLRYCECQNSDPNKPCNKAEQTVVAGSVLFMMASWSLVVSQFIGL